MTDDAPLSARQLAGILQRAANLRRDVKRARIAPIDGEDGLMMVDVTFHTQGRRIRREASVARCLDGRTCGQILSDWLGPQPAATSTDEADALRRERNRYLVHTPDAVHWLNRRQRVNLPPPVPHSRLQWPDQADRPDNPDGVLPATVPEEPQPAGQPAPVSDDRYFYTDAGGERQPKLTRKQMVSAGMTREQRHAQYRTQGGRHPDDVQADGYGKPS